jgi:anti-anti-sigma regulatory factor
MRKSPSGALCPYYFMGGELQPLHYGSYYDDKDGLFEMIRAEEEFILKSPGMNNRRVWIDLYETSLDDDTIAFLLKHFTAIRSKIYKLCLVGCSKRDERRIKMNMKHRQMDLYSQTQYFDDPEEAKRWLVSEKVV